MTWEFCFHIFIAKFEQGTFKYLGGYRTIAGHHEVNDSGAFYLATK